MIAFGLNTFGDITADGNGRPLDADAVIRDVVAEAVAAEEAGIDVFGIGEHHRADFAVSSPETVLAAIAGRTRRIRLGSAVTVLSSDDPVRVFQRFSTLAAVSDGRAELIAGRGSFTESFPLFGQELADYNTLFEEKLGLLVRLVRERRVTWSGGTRPALNDVAVVPALATGALALAVGAGGSPDSVVRAARHGLPLMLAVIGGDPRRFAPLVDLYRRAETTFGGAPQPVAIHSPGHVGETDAAARDAFFPPYKRMLDTIGRERGWPPLRRDDYDREIEQGSLYVGSPDTVARKIAAAARALGLARFDLKYSAGHLSHPALLQSIRLYGTRVVPLVRDMLR